MSESRGSTIKVAPASPGQAAGAHELTDEEAKAVSGGRKEITKDKWEELASTKDFEK